MLFGHNERGTLLRKLVIRVRGEHDTNTNRIKSYDVVIKNRYPNRLITASYDISKIMENSHLSMKKKPEIKFEEDILTPFVSKFPNSVKIDFQSLPNLAKYQHLESVLPNLHLNIPSESCQW